MRKELVFVEVVKDMFPIYVSTQFKVLSYRVDMYIPQANLVIEYDEHYHKTQVVKDANRQQLIEQALNCQFIRVKEGDEINGLFDICRALLSTLDKETLLKNKMYSTIQRINTNSLAIMDRLNGKVTTTSNVNGVTVNIDGNTYLVSEYLVECIRNNCPTVPNNIEDNTIDNNTTILGDILYTEIPKGVSFLKGRSKPYMVRVTTKGITKLIGYYTTAKEAEQAYLSYKQSLKQ